MLVLFVTPYFTHSARLFLDRLAAQPGVRLAVVAQEDLGVLPETLRRHVVHFVRVESALRAADVTAAAREVTAKLGPLHRIVGPMEQVQEAMAAAREALGLVGMHTAVALNFRDKNRMKDLARSAGLPVARHQQVASVEAAQKFASQVGFPLVVKPPAGAASQETFRVEDDFGLRAAFAAASKEGGGVALLEEFVTGQEHSFDAFVKDGRILFHSVTDYLPTCLDAMENAWIQWCILLRRDQQAQDMAQVGQKLLTVLGMDTGMIHGEWFRRKDGSVVISEVGARPGGAMIPTLISRAHDVDCVDAWARLMTTGEWTPFPERAYATGAAFLRGQGRGKVRAVHGLERIWKDLDGLVTDTRLPYAGQEKGKSYEGEGVICVRHRDTHVVEQALRHIITHVRVELG